MASITTSPGDDASPGTRSWRDRLPRRWYLVPIGVFAVAAAGVGVHAWNDYRTLTSAKFRVVNYSVPTAPHLLPGAGETLYRIDPTHYSVKYEVNEKLFGRGVSKAQGTTNGISGDIALNPSHPASSRVGQIVVNVEQLHSDNNLRDARMRASNLD